MYYVSASQTFNICDPIFNHNFHRAPLPYNNNVLVGSLVVRASDSRPEGLGSMPDATKHPPSTHGSTCRNCGDRGRVAIYRSFGEFRRSKIVLSPVWCSRSTTDVPLAHATMNFVGLDLTTSDRPLWGCGSPVVKVSDHGRHVMSSSPVSLKTHRVGQRCTLNLSRAETSSRWCGS
ncbi:uncharacterized protein TNCV_3233021 [Trichonephila clavipes]|nr:uncharacterized protein TNCV_3233021 [Trichonephila clavipes]